MGKEGQRAYLAVYACSFLWTRLVRMVLKRLKGRGRVVNNCGRHARKKTRKLAERKSRAGTRGGDQLITTKETF